MSLEQLSNNAQTTLSHDVLTSDSSIQISNSANFPSNAQYRILIDSELMLVTGGASSTTWNVTRNIEGTSLAGHSSGVKVTHILTSGGLTQFLEDTNQSDIYVNLPSPLKSGRLFLPTNGNYIYRDNGSTWAAFGPIFPLIPPVPSDFSWLNQGGASLDTSGGSLCLIAPSSGGTNIRAQLMSIPGIPYTCTIGFILNSGFANYNNAGIVLYDPGSGKLVSNDYGNQANTPAIVQFVEWSAINGTANALLAATVNPCGLFFLQLQDDGTNWLSSFSMDGIHFIQYFSVARNTYITPSNIGLYCDNEAAIGVQMYLNVLHWNLTTP